MASAINHVKAYRSVLREVSKSSKAPHATRDKTVTSSLRAIIAKQRTEEKEIELFNHDIQNVATFLRAQREHKILSDRYNPLVDLTAHERIVATTRRVGLDMPKLYDPNNPGPTPEATERKRKN
ncbi:hypothetical protein FIBSPDRAFT_1036497 [Athelia psychrophila]|uniref:Uncharacterized protein n=1 Tax=Athelia psychrophila TaxID=1759441 RepID=A0A166VLZ5_9AGAM|nr:hypothetical protein FIBSPDRAFT_1036497 [Fibularhizoctonia sp. CBS 109695]